MSSFDLQADFYNSLTPADIENKELKEKLANMEEERQKITNNPDDLEKKIYEELQQEFMENLNKGLDVYASMLKGISKVLTKMFSEFMEV